MKVIVCTGSPGSGLTAMSSMLATAGIAAALPSGKDGLTPTTWHEQLLRESGNETTGQAGQMKPNGNWKNHAIGIMESNVRQNIWGWTHPYTTWLLDFWKELDAEIHFVLTYAGPEYEYAERMHNGMDGPDSVGGTADTWLQYNRQLLRFYNRNRDRSILINSSACINDPGIFFQLCQDSFGLAINEKNNVEELEALTISPIAGVLSFMEISRRDDIRALHLEINATASLPGVTEENNITDKARDEYLSLLGSRQNLTARLKEITQRLQQTREQSNQRQQVQSELDKAVETNRLLESEKEMLRQELQARQDAVNNNEKTLSTVELEKNELKTENELLLLQLHQVQEELEHYFLLYQESEEKANSQSARPQEGRYSIPMYEAIDGENWYQEENDGDGSFRWTGPDARASIKIPLKCTQESLLIIEYRNSLTSDQLDKLSIEVNGNRVPHKIYKRTNPKYIVAQLAVLAEEPQEKMEVALILPRCVSPASLNKGSQDKRMLGLCVNSVSVIPSQPSLHLPASASTLVRLKQRLNRMLYKLSAGGFPLGYFDGRAYLEARPEVKEQVQNGRISSALAHYLAHGINKHEKCRLATSGFPCEGSQNDIMQDN